MFNVASLAPAVPALPGYAGYQALNEQSDELFKQFKNFEIVEREVDRFTSQMSKIDSAKDVTKDYRTFNFMLNAYNLEGFDYANDLVERVLGENINNDDAIANRLKNPAFKEMASDFQSYLAQKELGNVEGAKDVLKGMANKYLRQAFEKSVGRNAPAVAQALNFKRTVGDSQYLYNVIADEKNYEVLRKAYQIPDQVRNMGVEEQKERLSQVISIEDLQNPEKQDEIVRRFLAVSRFQNVSGIQPENSGVTTVLDKTTSLGGGGGSSVLPGMSGSSSSLLSSSTSGALLGMGGGGGGLL